MESPATVPLGLWRLNSIIRRSRFDVVQCWMYRSNLVGGLLAQAARRPVVWGIHCSSLAPLRRASRILAHVSGVIARWNPDFIINCSTRSAELHAKLGYSAAPNMVIHNGFDPAEFFPSALDREAARKTLGVRNDEFLIGSITRWIGYKDVPTLLSALRIAADRGVPLRCVLLGQNLGPDNEELMNAIRRAHCVDLVLPLGMRSDVQDIARAMDLHVLPSLTEAFPNVVAETMLSGTPNAVTDVGDSALIVGESGWVVPIKRPELFADAIVQAYRELNEQPIQWQNRRIRARQLIEERFTFRQMTEAYETVWRAVLTLPKPKQNKSAGALK